MSEYNRAKPSEFRLDKFEQDFDQFYEAVQSAMRHLKFKVRRFYQNLPYYQEYLVKLSNEITRLRRKLGHAKSETRQESLRRELKPKNARFKQRVKHEKQKLKREMYSVSDEMTFWRVWKKSTPFDFADMPVFEANENKSIDSNIEILADTS